MNILIGIIGIIVSFLLVIYRVPIKHFMGQIEWAEQKFGSGGTYTFLLLAAIVLFFVSLAIMTDTFGVLLAPFSKFFASSK